MILRERWGGWKREPFTSESRKHVSVWENPRPLHLVDHNSAEDASGGRAGIKEEGDGW